MKLSYLHVSRNVETLFRAFNQTAVLFTIAVCINGSFFAKGLDECRSIMFKEQMNGMALNNHVIKHKQVSKQGVCEIQCFREPDCVSYNYGTQIDGSFLCELNNKTHLQVPDELQARNGFIYRPITVNPCMNSPCAEHSTCQAGFNGDRGYRCVCFQGYHGDLCRLDDDECALGNYNCSGQHTKCVNVPGSFRCDCKTGYTGDGVNCTAEPPKLVSCASVTPLPSTETYEINADLSPFSTYGFCRVMRKDEVNAGEPYTLTVDLLNVNGKNGVGHLGAMYNVIDENNFDFVYFRPHESTSSNICCQLGYVLNGAYKETAASSCPNGPPTNGVWFTARVVVGSDKSVNVFLDDALVTSLTAHYDTRGSGGAVVATGYENIIRFRGYSLCCE